MTRDPKHEADRIKVRDAMTQLRHGIAWSIAGLGLPESMKEPMVRLAAVTSPGKLSLR